MKKAAVVGGAGYAGIEAVRLLLSHPDFELTCVTSTADAGRSLADLYPALTDMTDLVFDPHDIEIIAKKADVAFLAVPHTASLALTPALVEKNVQVIDLSADYRLSNPEVYESWYGVKHTSTGLLAKAIYAMPEIAREKLVTGSAVIACPGCYPTASALATLPVCEAGLLGDAPVVIAALSGVSGAGRKATAKTHLCAAGESVGMYGFPHRHAPEIAQTLSRAAGREVSVVFTPHLVPMVRGLLATAYIPLATAPSLDELYELYAKRYEEEPFVSVLDAGVMPQTSWVSGSNRAQVGLTLDAENNLLVASCAIDNLVKGAAGQAIQAANIVCGFDEVAGLDSSVPVV